jgi:hypothetical protein
MMAVIFRLRRLSSVYGDRGTGSAVELGDNPL